MLSCVKPQEFLDGTPYCVVSRAPTRLRSAASLLDCEPLPQGHEIAVRETARVTALSGWRLGRSAALGIHDDVGGPSVSVPSLSHCVDSPSIGPKTSVDLAAPNNA